MGQPWQKTCGTCGRVHTIDGWFALPRKGVVEGPAPLELRQCYCNSTLAIEVAVGIPELSAR